VVAARDVVDADGNSLEAVVTAVFMEPATPLALAERSGVRLGLESAKTFYTFSVSG
jgi:hypothetical protein